MTASIITLTPLTEDDREQFILDNQYAFKFGAIEEFGMRDDHLDGDGEIISRGTIEHCIDHGVAYRIRENGKIVGGLILKIDEQAQRGELEILFVSPDVHSKGIGSAAWREVERLYPETQVWETCTPYFEKRNITSTSTNSDFTPSNSSANTTTIHLKTCVSVRGTANIPKMTKVPTRCSDL